jgi:hypothetical protein
MTFTVPANARPSSLDSPRIRWALKTHCDIAGWPDSDDEYEVRVRLIRPKRLCKTG